MSDWFDNLDNHPGYTPPSRQIDGNEQESILQDLILITKKVENLASFNEEENDLLNKGIELCLTALKEY